MRYSPGKLILFFGLFILFFVASTKGQGNKPAAKKETPKPAASPKPLTDKQLIDSLVLVTINQTYSIDSLNRMLANEKLSTADLRDQVITLDDYRKKLEETISSFKGENLKLNQSNRILIVFNSLVAVLLITSLIFFLRKIGRRNKPAVNTENKNNSIGSKSEPVKFTNFEDKLQQLERLGKLREKELLSEQEFIVEKQRILGK